MPRLPVYIAHRSLGTNVPSRQPDMNAWLQSAQATQIAGQALSQIGAQVDKGMVEANERTRQAQQSMQALKAFSDASVQAEDLKGQLERDPDYENVPTKMQTGLKGIYDQQAQALTDPAARQLFERDFLRLSIEKNVQATHLRNTKRIDNGLANLDASVNTLTTLAADSDPSALPEIMGRVSVAYRDAMVGGLLSQEKAVKGEQSALQTIAEGAARQDIDRDPDGAAGRIQAGEGVYNLLPAEKRATLKEHASSVALTRDERERQLEHDTLAMAEKELKDLEKRTDQNRKYAVTDLEAQALNGDLDLLGVEAARRERILVGEDYLRVRKMVTDPKETSSDRDLLATLTLDAESQYPKTSAKAVDGYYMAGRLSLKDAAELKGKLTQRATAIQAKGETETGRRHSQAEQLVRSGLTTRSPFETLDPVSQEMQTMALQELTRRSAVFDGKEDPLAVAQEILPKYQQTLVDRGKVSVEAGKKLVGQWTPQALEAAKVAGTISLGEYQTVKDALLKLQRAQMDLDAMNARRQAQPQGKK